MGVTDNNGNIHGVAGSSTGGQFQQKNNSAPAGGLADQDAGNWQITDELLAHLQQNEDTAVHTFLDAERNAQRAQLAHTSAQILQEHPTATHVVARWSDENHRLEVSAIRGADSEASEVDADWRLSAGLSLMADYDQASSDYLRADSGDEDSDRFVIPLVFPAGAGSEAQYREAVARGDQTGGLAAAALREYASREIPGATALEFEANYTDEGVSLTLSRIHGEEPGGTDAFGLPAWDDVEDIVFPLSGRGSNGASELGVTPGSRPGTYLFTLREGERS